MRRHVRLVVCSATGEVLGELPAFDVEPHWWPEAGPVVAGARELFGLDVAVLRLLEASGTSAEMGGDVTYLAELLSGLAPAALRPFRRPDHAGPAADHLDPTADHPLRAAWARPGGIATTVAWADDVLAAAGRPRSGPAVQVKSWNLSSLLRLPTAAGDVWCKSTPPFLAQEGSVLALLAGGQPSVVPPMLGYDLATRTVLLDDVPGEDQWDAPVERLVEMVRLLVAIQADWAARTDELLAVGAWDWRTAAFAGRAEAMVRRDDVRGRLTASEGDLIDQVVADLPRVLTELGSCGLPDTLVHGDFHPGNWRLGPEGLVLLDWGDVGVGHPMLDVTAFLPRLRPADRPIVRAAWVSAWRAARPAADPARAIDLIEVVAALRQAMLYRAFLDAIEPAEQRYHEDDPARWLRAAIGAAGRG